MKVIVMWYGQVEIECDSLENAVETVGLDKTLMDSNTFIAAGDYDLQTFSPKMNLGDFRIETAKKVLNKT